MARRISTPIDLEVDTAGVLRMEEAAGGLDKALRQLQHTVGATFSGNAAAQFAKSTTTALNKVSKSVQGVKRSLADFDELQRLGSQKVSSSTIKKTGTQLLLEMLQNYDTGRTVATLNLISGAVDKVNTLIQISLGRMQQLDSVLSIQAMAVGINTAAWQLNATARENCIAAGQALIVGALGWSSSCATSTAATVTLQTALKVLSAQLQQILVGFGQLRTGAQLAISAWQQLGLSAQVLSMRVSNNAQVIAMSMRNMISPTVLTWLQAGMNSIDRVFLSGFSRLLASVKGSFLPSWRLAWMAVTAAFCAILQSMPGNMKLVANSTIGVFNSMLSGIALGYNQLINGLNRHRAVLSATTGKAVALIPNIPTPRIPQLATGAVLPANRPFMAVVGDQRHGTNIEAPLSTIQEAVALVMEDQTAAIMAGFEASVGVQKAILEAVLGISIGDDVIGQASQRYMEKMAIMRGGQW